MNNSHKIKKLIIIALLLAISIVISIIEGFISFSIPGIKLGLANCITLVCLYFYSYKETIFIVILRIFLVNILLGNFLSVPFYMSLSGGLLALIIMIIVKKINVFSIIGVSIIGALSHSIGQIIATFFLLDSILTIYYLPILLICSLFSGVLTGYIAIKINNILKNKLRNVDKKI